MKILVTFLLAVTFPLFSFSNEWKIQTKISPLDDSESVYISLKSKDLLNGWPRISFAPEIVLRCKENKLESFIRTDMSDSGDFTKVTLRFDDYAAYSENWSNSSNKKALFVRSNNIEEFINKTLVFDKLYFQITPFNSNPTSATFNLSGLKKHMYSLEKSCNWKSGGYKKISKLKDLISRRVEKKLRDTSSSFNFYVNEGKVNLKVGGFKSFFREQETLKVIKNGFSAIEESLSEENRESWFLNITIQDGESYSNTAFSVRAIELETLVKEHLDNSLFFKGMYKVAINNSSHPLKVKAYRPEGEEYILIDMQTAPNL